MYFSKAVPAGEELCTEVASLIVKKAERLKVGSARGRLANPNDTSIIVKTRMEAFEEVEVPMPQP